MLRLTVVLTCLLAAGLGGVAPLPAQMPEFPGVNGDFDQYVIDRYGEFLSWYKLSILVGVWLLWVLVADRCNRDLLRWSEDLEVSTGGWNLVFVACLLAGLGCVLFIPVFWIGLPVFLLGAFLPPFVYACVRRSRIRASATLVYRIRGRSDLKEEDFAHSDTNSIQFLPHGDASLLRKLQIESRQSSAYELMRNLLGNGLAGRVDMMLLDYSRQAVGGRMQIDGVWTPMPPLDRVQGDAMLAAIKGLAGMNPKERRQKQNGRFDIKWEEAKLKAHIEVTSEGVPTGEQVMIKYQRAVGKPRTYTDLGMGGENGERARLLMNAPGLVIISAPAHGGLTTLWQSSLVTMDRIMRDCIGLLRADERETSVENIQQHRFRDGQSPAEMLRVILLTQPDVLVVPEFISPQFADLVIAEIAEENRMVITRAQASSAAEALLKTIALVGNRKQFIEALTCVVNQRLVRRLCRSCRVEVPVKADVISRLGGNPAGQKTLYRHYQLPPLEQRVDEKGNPVFMEPCENCQGTGFRDRIAALEVVAVEDSIRRVLSGQPDQAALEKAFRAAGCRSLLEEASRLVLAGETSLDEVRRVFRAGAAG